jgi:RNA polymerase sigma factor (sigma-70 family)
MDPTASPSITRLMTALKEGHASAIVPLFEAYFQRLVQLARRRLHNLPGVSDYDEDVALRAFHSICQRVKDPARSVHLTSRDDFWRLLATRTISRAIDLIRARRDHSAGEHDVEKLLMREPTPEEAAAMADECERLLALLDDPELRRIALLKVEGYTTEEIARVLNCVPRTVERKVSRIRLLWKEELKGAES